MKFVKISTGVMISLILSMHTNIANAEGCSLEGVVLKCNTEAKTAQAILKAFSSQQTRDMLKAPLAEKDRFQKNGDLEKYRNSMERNWRVITRLAKKQELNRDRRRLSEQQYQEWAKNYAEAKETYDVALNFYRQLHWQGKK